MKNAITLPVLALTVLLGASLAVAEKQSFDFKDPKGVNNASFVLDSEVEPIMGAASGISGEVMFDPKNPKLLAGKIVVDAKSVKTPNDRMNSKLHSAEWLDVEKNPTISFEVKRVKEMKAGKKQGQYDMLVIGVFTCCGVSKEMEVPVKVSYLPGRMQDRTRRPGDLLVLRAQFIVKRSDFKLGPEMPTVADEMQIRVAVVGGDPK